MTSGVVWVAVGVAVAVSLSFFGVITLSDTIFTVAFTVTFPRFFSGRVLYSICGSLFLSHTNNLK